MFTCRACCCVRRPLPICSVVNPTLYRLEHPLSLTHTHTHIHTHTFTLTRISSPIRRLPTLGGRELNLYRLYSKVREMKGAEKITRKRQWGEVARSFNLPRSVTSASYAIRQHYIRYTCMHTGINRWLDVFFSESPIFWDFCT